MSKQLVRVYSIFLILTILLAQFGIRPAAADVTFTVNSTADMVDANPGDGLCETDVTGDCTLRAAIQEANRWEGADTISIPDKGVYTLTIEGAGEDEAATGDLDITGTLTIIGAGMGLGETVIDANGLDRAFHVFASLNLSDVMIKNGFANPGGAVLVNSYASINRVTFDDNRATSSESNGTGGAIHIAVEASADISQSRFTNNFAHFGGGAVSNTFASSFTITDSTFDSNSSVLGGGALYPNGGSASINNSTFFNNSADTGGAIHSNSDFVEVTNSTFVENEAVNHGAIDSRVGIVIVNNSTFYGNTASGEGNTLGDQDNEAGGNLQVGNSIMYGTDPDVCDVVFGSVEFFGNNLTWPEGSNCPVTQADPLLDMPDDNGGPTETMALLAGSPAIDAGDIESCADTDQRGVPRPQGETCDIGAFEAVFTNIFVVTNTTDSGEGSLRQAILDANAALNSTNGPDEIHFNIPSESVNTIAPSSALPAITEPVVIDGYTQPGASANTLASGNNANILVELIGNNCDGVCGQALLLSSGGSTITGLSIYGNFNNGIEVNGSGSTIVGNFIGLKADGSPSGVIASGVYLNNTSNNTVGGTIAADRNVISANRDGIFIAAGAADATDNIVAGNYIGTNAAGTAALGNSQRGIFVGSFDFTASSNSISGNVISGNGRFGVLLRDANVTGNSVTGNLIGLDATGTEALPNGNNDSGDDGLSGTSLTAGIYVGGPDNAIGGLGRVAAGNTIAYNNGAGVHVGGDTGTNIRANDIHSNSELGVDLAGDGITFNHVGFVAGPNNYQNYPVLTVATSDGETLRVGGYLESEANQDYTIDVFSNETCDPTFFGEGERYLGSFSVSTDEFGVEIFDQPISAGVAEPIGISATATGTNGTSEFSYCRPVATPNLNWVQAQEVSTDSQTQQYITDVFQEKWFKFPVQPGASVSLTLTSLPGSAISLHRDPLPIYNSLINPENSTLITAEASDVAFLPSGSLPSGSLPSGSLPSGSLPSGSLPSG